MFLFRKVTQVILPPKSVCPLWSNIFSPYFYHKKQHQFWQHPLKIPGCTFFWCIQVILYLLSQPRIHFLSRKNVENIIRIFQEWCSPFLWKLIFKWKNTERSYWLLDNILQSSSAVQKHARIVECTTFYKN